MGRNTEEKEIDGRMWHVTVFSATEGLGIMSKLTKLLGGPIGKAIAGFMGGGEGPALDPKIISEAFESLAGRLDESEVVGLIKRLLKGTSYDGDKGNRLSAVDTFDVIFMRAYGTLFKVVAFVLEANFAIPLAAWLSELPGLMAGAQIPE